MPSLAESLVSSHPSPVFERVNGFDWDRVGRELDAQGNAALEGLISPDECRTLAGLYGRDELFRNRILMARPGLAGANTSTLPIPYRI